MNRRYTLIILLALVLAIAGCAETAPPPAPEPATIDTDKLRSEIAASIFATLTASAPLPTDVPTRLPPPTDTPRPTVTPGPSPTLPAQPAKREFNHPYVITQAYDSKSNRTQVSFMGCQNPAPLGSVCPIAGYSFTGRLPTIPDEFVFSVVAVNDDWRYLTQHDLTLVLDGRTRLAFTTSYTLDAKSSGTEEDITGYPDLGEFLQIANASSVTVELGDDEFSLTDGQMEAFRDLASRMVLHAY